MGFSRRQVKRKVYPVLRANSGLQFPLEQASGKHVPFWARILGWTFRLRRHPETASQSEPEFWDGFSAWGDVDAGHGRLQSDRHRICIGLRLCAENPRICFANPHRLRPPAGVLARSLQTLRVCLTPAPCIEFDSPRYGGSVDAGRGQLKFDKHRIYIGLRLCAKNPRICFANTHRLRPAAAALARGLKTLTRFLYARALHRVRFSAVRTRNKKAGRYEYLPACYLWWRRGESNSGPRKPPDWHLQAQSLV